MQSERCLFVAGTCYFALRLHFIKCLQDSTNQPSNGFISCDGEAVQLEAVLKGEIFSLMKEKQLIFGKISASCSGIHQASDVSSLFRNTKKKVRTMTRNEDVVSNPVLENILRCKLDNSEHRKIRCLSESRIATWRPYGQRQPRC